jgi:hypothetical protein
MFAILRVDVIGHRLVGVALSRLASSACSGVSVFNFAVLRLAIMPPYPLRSLNRTIRDAAPAQ